MVAAAAAIVLLGNLSWAELIAVKLLLVGGLVLLDRVAAPIAERWGQGADGEEHVGRVLEDLEAGRWLAIHDIDTGRGNIDTVVVGPGGLLTIEVKSHGGRLRPDQLDAAWLRQAYAQRKWLEGIAGRPATALLVLSRAYLVDRPVSQQRGVVVLPARMLAGYLRRRSQALSTEQARLLHDRLAYAIGGLEPPAPPVAQR